MGKTKYWIGNIVFIFLFIWFFDGFFQRPLFPTTIFDFMIIGLSIFLVIYLRDNEYYATLKNRKLKT